MTVGDGKKVSDEEGAEAGYMLRSKRGGPLVLDIQTQYNKNKTQSTSKSTSQAVENTSCDGSGKMPAPSNADPAPAPAPDPGQEPVLNDVCEQLATCYCCNYQGKVDNTELAKFNQHDHGILEFDDISFANIQQYPCPLHQDIIALPSDMKTKLYEHNKFVIEVSLTNQYLVKFKDDLSQMDPPREMLRIVVCCAFLHKRLSPRKNINLCDIRPEGNAQFNIVIYAIVKDYKEGTVVRGGNYLEGFLNYWKNANDPKLADLHGRLPKNKNPGSFNILFHEKHQLRNQDEDADTAKTLFERWMCGSIATDEKKKTSQCMKIRENETN
jgi:hypothetical protein